MFYIYRILFLFISFSLLSQQQFPGGTVGVGGSYNLTYPPEPCPDPGGCNFDLYNLVGGGAVGAIRKGSTYQGPFQTHNWWNTALWDIGTTPCVGDVAVANTMHSGIMRPFPAMALEAIETGQVVRHREKALNGGGVNNSGSYFADRDIITGIVNTGANNFYSCAQTEVMDYGDMHVRMRQDFGSGNVLETTASSGCPFVFFEKTGTAPMGFFLFFIRATAISSSGNSFTTHRSIGYGDFNQRQYGLFFPPGTTISSDNGTSYVPISTLPHNGITEWGGNNKYFRINFPAGQNYFVISIMPDTTKATLDLFEQYAFNKITDSRYTYAYNEATATMTANFACTTTNVLGGVNSGTLMAQYLHQYRNSPQHPANYTGRLYNTARGAMRICTGNTFSVIMKNKGFLPALGYANTANKTQLYNFAQTYAFGRGFVNMACGNPVYGSFGSIHEAARIAEIAHAVGNYAARDRLLAIAKDGIEKWLTSLDGEYAGMYYYDRDFNWLTPFPSAFDADRLLQDSHFHHGYIVYAAAIVARFQSVLGYGTTWADQWGPMVNLVIRNINDYQRNMTNPAGVNSPWFPYLRYFDPYAGHSWAGHDASNQESVSEAINFAAGAALWGETTGDIAIRDMGIMMYIVETEAARMYWWDTERIGINRAPFAPGFNHYHAGILGSDGAAYATFFGANAHYVHGITYVPITGSSIWMGTDSMGAANEQADFQAGFGSATDGSAGFWSTVMLMQQATYDAANAKTRFLNESVPNNWSGNDYDVDGLYWITTFDSVGVVDNTQADIASFAVFRKDNCKHYMVYMPPGKGPRTVNFSDGKSFLVPDDTIITFKDCNIPLPARFLYLKGKIAEKGNELNWVAAEEKENTWYRVEVSSDGKNFTELITMPYHNTGGVSSYYYLHETTSSGLLYYRVVQLSATNAISNVVSLKNSGSGFIVQPVPASSELTVTFAGELPQQVRLVDLNGRLVKDFGVPSHSETEYETNNLPSGVYVLQVEYTAKSEWRRIEILR